MTPTTPTTVHGTDSVLDVVREHARKEHLPVVLAATGAGLHDAGLRRIASDPLLHPAVARAIVDGRDDGSTMGADILRLVATNRSCPLPADLLDHLLRHPAPAVSQAAARRPDVPLEMVRTAVDAGAADNVLLSPACPPEQLAEVVHSKKRRSDHALAAANPALPARERNRLARDAREDVQRALLLNPRLTQSDFSALSRTRSSDERSRRRDARSAGSSVGLHMYAWAAHRNADPAWLAKLWRSGTVDSLRVTVAQNPRTPSAVLEEAFRLGLLSVLTNPAMPQELAEVALLTSSPGSRVRTGRDLAVHPNTPLHVLELIDVRDILLGNDMHPSVANELKRMLALVHTRSASQATLLLGMLDGWDVATMPSQSVAQLLTLTAAAAS